MKRSLARTLQRLPVGLAAVFVFTTFGPGLAQAAETAPNTVISNTATASYTDSNGNTYNTNSNTVTTTVQNAPALTDTPQAAQTVSDNETVVDTYTLTNTGNAAGDFQLTAPTTPVSANGTLVGYVVNGAATGTCSVATPCTLAQANTALAAISVPVGSSATVGVEYTVNAGVTSPNTITTALDATITQPTAGAAAAATSAAVDATDTDNLTPQARLDLYKTVGTFTGTAPIPFTINANDGGGQAAHDLASARALLDAGTGTGKPTVSGVLITDKIPTFGGTPLLLSGAIVAANITNNTGVAGQTATVFYTTDATGSTNWTTTFTAGTAYTYVGVYLSGGAGGIEFPADAAGSTGTGTPQTTTQFSFTFSVAQPTGAGSGSATAISNLANSVIGGVPNATGTIPLVGPNIPVGTIDSASATADAPAITNTTAGTGATAPGGASNIVTTGAVSAQSVVNGPLDNPTVSGQYPGATTASNQNDFTATAFDCAGTGNTGVTNAIVVTPTQTANCLVPTAGVTLPGSFTNTGNAADTFGVSVTAPAGFKAQVFLATGCTTTPTSLATTGCVASGVAIATATATATAPATATGNFVGTVASGATVNYIVVYTPISATTSVVPFAPIDSAVTIAGQSGAGTGTDANTTHFDIYPGGVIKVVKTASSVTNCPTGPANDATGATVCPGGTITYVLAYSNVAPATASAGAGTAGNEPTFAVNAITANGGMTITEDGTAAPNNWAANSGGLLAAVTATVAAGPTPTFTYTPAAAVGATKFVATFATAVGAGSNGTLTFSVKIN